MRLTSPGVKRRALPGRTQRRLTTEPGFINPNRQQTVASTGAPSTVRDGQTIHRLKCGDCSREYGCSGIDIKDRLCPFCQGGAKGEPLREAAPGLFDAL